MNDEELNELIARSDQESVIFREMDIQRDRESQESWRLSGNRGKPPLPLMQLEELPECYQTDEPFEVKEVDDLVEGRGQRRRNVVSYNDGLSDDAWALVCIFITIRPLLPLTSFIFLQALEEGEDLQELSERTRDKKDRRSTSKFPKDTDISARGTPISDDIRSRKNNKKAKTKAGDYETSLPAGSKRKRGTKSSSVTPSIADDEDEDHDQVRARSRLQYSCFNDGSF